jgi:hypothetical protein
LLAITIDKTDVAIMRTTSPMAMPTILRLIDVRNIDCPVILVVMPGLVPGIHDFSVFESEHYQKD